MADKLKPLAIDIPEDLKGGLLAEAVFRSVSVDVLVAQLMAEQLALISDAACSDKEDSIVVHKH